MNNSNYCRDCSETLTLHADGSVACSCDFLAADSTEIPLNWDLNQEQLADGREVTR